MKKNQFIKDKKDFDFLIKKGNRIHNNYFSIYWKNSDKFLLGVSVPKRNFKAFERNRLKRNIKSIFHELDYKEKISLVIIIKKDFFYKVYSDKKNIVENNLRKIK